MGVPVDESCAFFSLAGVAIGVGGATYVGAQGTPQVTRTEILRKPMTGMEGKEVVVFLADLPPGAVAGRHFHPGDEPIYMLQGTLLFEPAHGQPFEFKAGEISFNPAKHVHKAKKVGCWTGRSAGLSPLRIRPT